MDYKKVSVILPIYNQENNLDISLPAIMQQSWSNLEIIAVNDGSTDSSEKIIDAYREKDDRIKKISKDNGGLVDAVISGIKAATGDYICFLDPDDYVGIHFVENFMNNIADKDFIAMGYFESRNGDTVPKYLLKDKIYNEEELKRYRRVFFRERGISGISNRFFISRWNKLYKTKCLKLLVPEFEKCVTVSLGEDSIFTFIMLGKCKSGIVLREPNEYFYVISSTSMTRASGSEKHQSKSLVAYKKLKKMLELEGYADDQAKALYYCLMNTLIGKGIEQNDENMLEKVRNMLNSDTIFCDAERISGLCKWKTFLFRKKYAEFQKLRKIKRKYIEIKKQFCFKRQK